jgi:hypothetical protein
LLTWFRQQPPLYGGRSTTLTLAEQQYRLFALPVQLGQRGNWLLCGTVLTAQFDREARALPAGWSVFIMGLVLLVLLTLPFLKLALMSEREQLSRTDLAQCVLALVLGTSILLLTCQATLVRHYFEQVRIDSQLRSLKEQVTTSLQDFSGVTGRAYMPLLPPGFSYGVADGRGAVHLHSAPALHIGENLRQSCVPSQPVVALLNGFIDTLTTIVTYRDMR